MLEAVVDAVLIDFDGLLIVAAADARIIEEDVEPTEGVDGLYEALLDRAFVGHVES